MLDAVIQRLAALTDDANKAVFTDVEDALALSEISQEPFRRGPKAYVIALDENPRPDTRGTGPALQQVLAGVGVVIAIGKHNCRRGEKIRDALEHIRQQVRGQLFGWAPTQEHEPFVLGRGRLLAVQPGVVYWVDRFITEYCEDANS